jgi:PPOX class probable F420-dependent enzyme
MSDDEARRFLATGTRTGKLAVVRADGSPLVVPVWFVVEDDGDLVFTTAADTLKGRALRRDGRMSLCVDEEAPPYAYVRVDGRAELSEDPAALLDAATRIAARYMGEALAWSYGRRNAVPGELLVRLRPSRLVGVAGVAD